MNIPDEIICKGILALFH